MSIPSPVGGCREGVNPAGMNSYVDRLHLSKRIACLLYTSTLPLVILSVVSLFYTAFRENLYIAMMLEGMQAGVGAVIASVVYDMGEGIVRGKKYISILIMVLSFICLLYTSSGVRDIRPYRTGGLRSG